jgi:hypothetical protein
MGKRVCIEEARTLQHCEGIYIPNALDVATTCFAELYVSRDASTPVPSSEGFAVDSRLKLFSNGEVDT